MQHAPLVKVIQSLGVRERADLIRWVESPFVNRREEVTRLCQHLCHTVPARGATEEEPEALAKIAVYAKVFGSASKAKRSRGKTGAQVQKLSEAEDTALRYTMSFLFAALKSWLAYREWRQDDAATGLMLCRALRKRELDAVYEKEFKTLQIAASRVRKTEDFSFANYQIQFERLEFNVRNSKPDPVQLKKASDAFGVYVANIALRHGCAAFNSPERNLETIDYLPETLARIESGYYSDVPSVQVYYRCLRLLQHREEADYQFLKSLLLEYSALFAPDEIRDPWQIALNYCIHRINSGEFQWAHETLEMYKNGLKDGLLLDNGVMPRSMHQNILFLAIKCGEWDWARQFLDDYRNALPVADRQNAYKFNLALWHFKRKEYQEAQEILLKVTFRDAYYNLDARRMMVLMYYDQGDFLALDSLLHSFRTYLLRHRNIGYHYFMYGNFIRIMQQILRLQPGDKRGRDLMRQKITREQYLAEREWLLEILG